MIIALAQMRLSHDMRDNHARALELVRRAALQGASLIAFPEIQLTRFFPQYAGQNVDDAAIGMDSAYIREMRKICREERIFAAPNYYIEEAGRRYDMSLLIGDDGSVVGRQKMAHIAQCERFYERDYYAPSEEGFQVFETKLGRIGIVVCFDRHYPESVRTEAPRGASLILIPTANTRDEPGEMFEWEIRVQAFQNSVAIAMCNRVGREDQMDFSGASIVTDCHGGVVARAGGEEELLLAEIDLEESERTRAAKPYTSLRRRELYE